MTKEEYDRKFHENQRVSGYGLDTTMHAPCPFCAAADQGGVFKILEVEVAMQKGTTCTECGRGWKALFNGLPGGGVQFEIVQTCGDDPPDYLPPIRRV